MTTQEIILFTIPILGALIFIAMLIIRMRNAEEKIKLLRQQLKTQRQFNEGILEQIDYLLKKVKI